MVEAVVSFVNCSEFDLVPAIASHVTLRQESIQSQGSNEVDLPPNYTAAAHFPVSVLDDTSMHHSYVMFQYGVLCICRV